VGRQIETSLNEVGLAKPKITIATAESLDPLPSGKLKRLVPLED
jgi:hypothetical protein